MHVTAQPAQLLGSLPKLLKAIATRLVNKDLVIRANHDRQIIIQTIFCIGFQNFLHFRIFSIPAFQPIRYVLRNLSSLSVKQKRMTTLFKARALEKLLIVPVGGCTSCQSC